MDTDPTMDRCPYCYSNEGASVALPAIWQCAGCDSIAHIQADGLVWYPSHRILQARRPPHNLDEAVMADIERAGGIEAMRRKR